METMNDLLTMYSLFCDGNEKLSQEKKWLNEKYFQKYQTSDDNWNSLGDKEKQIKRIKDFLSYRKTKGYHDGVFELEERVIDLYESIESCFSKLSNDISELEIRLKAHLLLVKKTINCYRDIRNVKDFFLNELQSVIIDCINSNKENYFVEGVNVLYLDIKLIVVQQLLNKQQL